MRYEPITEKPYCCVPAILQMIQSRRGLRSMSQDEIGWELGLIVPPEMKSEFSIVRTGPEPSAGYGTRTSKPEFSIENYFARNHLPLSIKMAAPASVSELCSLIRSALNRDDDMVLCLNSRHLFGDGDIEHVFLIEGFNEVLCEVTVVDPAIGAPKLRTTSIESIFETIENHRAIKINGVWIVSDRPVHNPSLKDKEGADPL